MSGLFEQAEELGRTLARTQEYQALKQVLSQMSDDRELVERRNDLGRLEEEIGRVIKAGEEPSDEQTTRYEEAVSGLQSNSTYQRLVAAQSNFDKVTDKVNETIARGLESGSDSQIIIPS